MVAIVAFQLHVSRVTKLALSFSFDHLNTAQCTRLAGDSAIAITIEEDRVQMQMIFVSESYQTYISMGLREIS
jgi:hypothetical protein